MSLRLFVAHNDDSITRIPQTHFRKLLDGETRKPEWADQRIRCVEVVVELQNRKPTSIVRLCPFFLLFDADGRLDANHLSDGAMGALDVHEARPTLRGPDGIIDAQHRFAKRRYEHEFRWTLTPAIIAAINTSVFKKPVRRL